MMWFSSHGDELAVVVIIYSRCFLACDFIAGVFFKDARGVFEVKVRCVWREPVWVCWVGWRGENGERER